MNRNGHSLSAAQAPGAFTLPLKYDPSALNGKLHMQDTSVYMGEWRLDLNANTLAKGQHSVRLEHKQVQLLLLLIAHSDRPVPRQELLDKIWVGRVVVEDVVAVAVSQVRKALQDNARAPKFIKTIPGVGYQFILPLTPQDVERAARHTGEIQAASPEPVAGALTRASPDQGFPKKRIIAGAYAATAGCALLLLIWLGGQQVKTAGAPESGSFGEASALYQQALQLSHRYTSDTRQQAMDLLEEALHLAPDYSDAYVLLARIKRDQVFHNPQASQSASAELHALLGKALEHDPDNANAHEALGNIALFVDWDFPAARGHIEQALALDNANAAAHHLYGLYWLAHNDFEKSYHHIVKARELNPLYYSIAAVAWVLAMQGHTEEAWRETEKLLSYRPDDLQYHRSALRLFEIGGEEQKAFHHLRAILELAAYPPAELASLDETFRRRGMAGVYEWLAFARSDARDIGFYAPPLSLARFAIGAGRYDEAFAWLEQAGQIRQRELLWLAVDPKYDPIKEDPRFTALMRKLELPH